MTETQGHFRQTIEIGQGLGHIKFGMSPEEVRQHLGVPQETENITENESAVMWYYSNLKLQIIFQTSQCGLPSPVDDLRRVVQLTTSHLDATLWETKIIGRTEDEVLNLFRAHGHDDFIREESAGFVKFTSYRLNNARVTLDFGDGLLWHVLWSPRSNLPPILGRDKFGAGSLPQ